MNIEEYKTELADSLYFGPWNECNPEKAVTLIRMAASELSNLELAELYCCYVCCCFDNSVKYVDQSKDYYEKAVSIFERLISLLDRQETDAVCKNIDKKVENIIELATQATGLASGYDWYLSDKWWSCKWNGPDYEDT